MRPLLLFIAVLLCTCARAQEEIFECGPTFIVLKVDLVDGATGYVWERSAFNLAFEELATTEKPNLTIEQDYEGRSRGNNFSNYRYRYRPIIDGRTGSASEVILQANIYPTPRYRGAFPRQRICSLPEGSSTATISLDYEDLLFSSLSYRVYGVDNDYDVTQDNREFSGLAPGRYLTEATNVEGCTSEPVEFTIQAFEPTETLEVDYFVEYDCDSETWRVSYSEVDYGSFEDEVRYSLDGENFQEDGTFSNVADGDYTLFVRNLTSCQTGRINLTLADEGTEILETTDAECGGDNGSVTFAVSNPLSKNYSFAIYRGDEFVTANWEGGPTITGLAPGEYTARNTRTGCDSEPVPFTIGDAGTPPDVTFELVEECGQPSVLTITNNGAGELEYVVNGREPTRDNRLVFEEGGRFYTVTARFVGTECGVDYEFQTKRLGLTISSRAFLCASDPGFISFQDYFGGEFPFSFSIDGGDNFTSGSFFRNLGPGTYEAVVRDATGCEARETVVIGDATFDLQATGITPAVCAERGGAAGAISFTGPDTDLLDNRPIYYIYDGDNNLVASNNSGRFPQIEAGDYRVFTSLSFQCGFNLNFTIPEVCPEREVALDYTEIDCAGGSSTLTASLLDPPTGQIRYRLGGGDYQTGNTFSLPGGGHYEVTAQVAGGGETTGYVYVPEPEALGYERLFVGDYSCPEREGSVTVFNIFGGSEPYSVSVDGAPFVEGNRVENLQPGVYTFTIRDANGCELRGEAFEVQDFSSTLTIAELQAATCDDPLGSIQLAGGGGELSLRLFDVDNNRVLSGYAAPGGFAGLPPGNYRVEEGSFECAASLSFSIADECAEGLDVQLSAGTLDCEGDETTLVATVTNGDGRTLEYRLNDGDWQRSPSFPITEGGNYTVVARYVGTTTTGQASRFIAGPQSFTVGATPTAASCEEENGTITVIPDGGNDFPPFSYELVGERGGQTELTFRDLAGGSYTLRATNSLGCTAEVEVRVPTTGPPTFSTETTAFQCAEVAGSIRFTDVRGGSGAYEFSIDGGVTYRDSPDFFGLSAGAYALAIRDGSGCVRTGAETVADASFDFRLIRVDNASCTEGGGVVLSNIGAGALYVLFVGDEQLATSEEPTFTDLEPATYRVEARLGDCTDRLTFTVGDGCQGLEVELTAGELNCVGDETTLTATVTNGDGSELEYRLGTGDYQSGNTFPITEGGSYTVTARYVGTEVTGQASVTIDAPQPFTVGASSTPATCGDDVGTITVIPDTENSATPFTYELVGVREAQPDREFTDLAAGTYRLRATNSLGCTAETEVTVTATGVPTFGVETVAYVCAAVSGSITFVEVTGGEAPYRYSIDGGEEFGEEARFSNLVAGTYDLVVEDANGCRGSRTVTVEDGSIPFLISEQTATSCSAGGAVTFNFAGGGDASVRYRIFLGDELVAEAENNPRFTDLPAGTYRATRSLLSCAEEELTFTIADGCTELAVELTADPIACAGGSTTLIATVTNGNGSELEYRLNDGEYQTGNTFEINAAGTYTVTARYVGTDITGTATLTISVLDAISFTVSTTDFFCREDAGTLTFGGVAGGTGPYEYSIDGGGTFGDATAYAGLDAGSYRALVRDASGCTVERLVTVTDESFDLGVLSLASASCTSGGSVTLTDAGEGRVYRLFDGTQEIATNTAPTFTDLSAGTYRAEVEIGDCTPSVVFTIADGCNGLEVELSVGELNCVGDETSLTATVTNGDGSPLEYRLNEGAYRVENTFTITRGGRYTVTARYVGTEVIGTATVEVADPQSFTVGATTTAASCGEENGRITADPDPDNTATPFTYELVGVSEPQAGLDFGGLSAGSYTLRATNADGCTAEVEVEVEVGATGAATFSVATTAFRCAEDAGSLVFADVEGGAMPYAFSIDGGATFGTETAYRDLAAGTYAVVVRTAAGCSSRQSVTVTDEAYELSVLRRVDADCDAPGSVLLSQPVSGPTATYRLFLGSEEIGGGEEPEFSELEPGDYRVTADRGECSYELAFTIVDACEAVTVELDATAIACAGETTVLTATVSGGNGEELEYRLDDGEYQKENTWVITEGGTYTVTVRYPGESAIGSAAITIEVPDPLEVGVETVASSCEATAGAIRLLSVTGGTAPYRIRLDGEGDFQEVEGFEELSAGEYLVELQDANGCRYTETVTVADNTFTLGIAERTDVSCAGALATITFTAPRVPAPSARWRVVSTDAGVDMEQEEPRFTDLPPGGYRVTYTADDCVQTFEFGIKDSRLTAEIETEPAGCDGAETGSIRFLATGGNGGYRYSIDGGASFVTDSLFSDLAAGTYSVVLRDEAECELQREVTVVGADDDFTLEADILAPGACTGDVGTVTLRSNSTADGLEYAVDGQDFMRDSVFTDLATGNYQFSVRRIGGSCIRTIQVDLEASGDGPLFQPFPDLTVCRGGTATVTPSFPVSEISYTLNDGLLLSTDTALVVEAGQTIIVTGRDAGGCAFLDTFLVDEGELALEAQFLVAGQAVVGQTVVLVEDSSPLPEGVSWFFAGPQVPALLLDSLNQFHYQFGAVGTYDITLLAERNGCSSQLTKSIDIVADSSELDPALPLFSEIVDFRANPNPTAGPVRVTVELSGARPVNLRVYSLGGTVLDQVSLPAAARHEQDFDLSGNVPGYHIINLTTGGESRNLTVILQ